MNPLQPLAEGLLDSLASVFPLGLAFGAGMVATVNPCGFALLPAYLALYLGLKPGQAPEVNPLQALLRALLIALAVTTGFVVLFGAVGFFIAAGGRFVVRAMPWASIAVGVAMVALGVWLLRGKKLYSGLAARLAAHIEAPQSGGVVSFFMFGIAYAIASLSCTLPVFLLVVGSSFTARGILDGTYQFISYALGMGFIITLLTVGTALFKGATASYLRRAMPYVERASAVLIIAAGGYILYYWLTTGRDLLLA